MFLGSVLGRLKARVLRLPPDGNRVGAGERAGAGCRPRQEAATRRFLAVIASPEDVEQLRRALLGSEWVLVAAATIEEALGLMDREWFPVVLCDRELPGWQWHVSVRALHHTRHPACVILASRVMDAYLWEEVIQRGAFDVITKPFLHEQVLRTMNFALAHWKQGWVLRQWDRFAWP